MSIPTKLSTLDSLITKKQDELDKIVRQKRKEINPLLKKREDLVNKLYQFMKVRNLTQYQGVFITDIQPKQKKEKKEKVSKKFQMAKLRQMGIRNPEAALKELGV
jgi:restriction endonuclease S subunit